MLGSPHTLKNSLTSLSLVWDSDWGSLLLNQQWQAGLFLSVNDRSSLADHTVAIWKDKSGL